MKNLRIALSLAAVLGLAAAGVALADGPAIGAAAPNFQLTTVDGKNFWVPSGSGLSVVNAETGSIVTLTGNGMVAPSVAAFDGQRVLVTSGSAAVNRVSLWKAADLTPLGYAFTGNSTQPVGVCSDGINFWITLSGSGQLARF